MRDPSSLTFPVLAAAAPWRTTGTAQAFAPVGAVPATIGTVKIAIGGIIDAHRLYLGRGTKLGCHHFSLAFQAGAS